MPLLTRPICIISLFSAALLIGACGTQPIVVVATITPPPPTETPGPTLTPSPTPLLYKDTLVIGLKGRPGTLHPLLDTSAAALHIQDALYERYVTSLDFAYQANPNGGLLADLPTLENGGAMLDDGGTPDDPVDDQLTVTFKMLPGPKWCDGRPVTAGDSVYAFNLSGDPDSGATSRAAFDQVEAYTALDAATIKVTFKPGQFELAYSSYFWTPLPEHLWGQYTALELQTAEVAARKPCGYGPYTIAGAPDQAAGWIANDTLALAANPHYFRGMPRTQRLIFKFIASDNQLLAEALKGSLDIVIAEETLSLRLPEYAGQEGDSAIEVIATHSPVWEQLLFNLNLPTTFDSTSRAQPHPILSDVRVRQAIAHAIDRRALIERVYAGRSIVLDEALVYPNHPLYTGKSQVSVYEYDPSQAQALLDAAGWLDTDGDGVRECRGCASGAAEGDRLALTYRTTSSVLRDPVVEQVKNDLDAVGFDITVELLPTEVFFGDVTGLIVGDFELGQRAQLTGIDPAGERQYGCDWIPSPDNGWYGENYSGWCNEPASAGLYEANRVLPLDARRAAYAVFQREYTRDLPGLPLFPRLNVFIVRRGLENFAPNDSMPSATWKAYALSIPNE
ncbi:MAG TPA: peptide ABC transporter substrate-binding protein [Anaerolineae bacterium]|nr:peptide ABC transporter substrate-binding protein [Anaerolineae bacterium]